MQFGCFQTHPVMKSKAPCIFRRYLYSDFDFHILCLNSYPGMATFCETKHDDVKVKVDLSISRNVCQKVHTFQKIHCVVWISTCPCKTEASCFVRLLWEWHLSTGVMADPHLVQDWLLGMCDMSAFYRQEFPPSPRSACRFHAIPLPDC